MIKYGERVLLSFVTEDGKRGDHINMTRFSERFPTENTEMVASMFMGISMGINTPSYSALAWGYATESTKQEWLKIVPDIIKLVKTQSVIVTVDKHWSEYSVKNPDSKYTGVIINQGHPIPLKIQSISSDQP